MISLNLLPPGRKEIFRWRRNLKKVISIGIRAIFLLVCFSVPLFVVNIYLMGEINVVGTRIDSYENTENMKRLKTMEKSFKDINNSLTKINKISEGQIYWVSVFDKITGIIPPSIQISSLQIEPDGKFVIVGNANTREDVLEFGKRLKNSSDFSDIQVPPECLVKSNDIDCRFAGSIKLDNFKGKGSAKTGEVNNM